MEDYDLSSSGVLEIYVHHARNIHNICIYDNQDVYAKFSLTREPDRTLSTRVVHGGGQNPDFEESLRMRVSHRDSVLKCEIWMLSRARTYMEDQLLGFALVPVPNLAGTPGLTGDHSLSSTDLFHSPAGTVRLTLSLHRSSPPPPHQPGSPSAGGGSSISSEVVLLAGSAAAPEYFSDYSRIEFPDVRADGEDQRMVSEYLGSGAASSDEAAAPLLLRLGAGEEKGGEGESVEESCLSRKEGSSGEAEQPELRRQVVEMYVRSVQQFTDSLAKMKLPMELRGDDGDVATRNDVSEVEKKKDGSRVFYGSRAFF